MLLKKAKWPVCSCFLIAIVVDSSLDSDRKLYKYLVASGRLSNPQEDSPRIDSPIAKWPSVDAGFRARF